MKNVCATILNAADNVNQNGSQVDANQLVSGSFMFYFGEATANGTVKIQASNDPTAQGAQGFTATNWVDIPNASASVTSGSSALIVIPNMAFRWIRAVFTNSSGGAANKNVVCNMNALSV